MGGRSTYCGKGNNFWRFDQFLLNTDTSKTYYNEYKNGNFSYSLKNTFNIKFRNFELYIPSQYQYHYDHEIAYYAKNIDRSVRSEIKITHENIKCDKSLKATSPNDLVDCYGNGLIKELKI